MKKISLIIFILLFSIPIFAKNYVKRYTFSSSKMYIHTKFMKKPKVLIKYTKNSNMIYVEFYNTKTYKNVKNKANNGKYIKKIDVLSGINNNSFFFITLQKNVNYKFIWNKNYSKLIFIFTKKIIKTKKITIVIDPGHGGKDPGAIGYNGIREKDVVLEIAKKAKNMLKDNYNVIITRSNNVFIPLYRRTDIANLKHAKLFISIHANASKSKRSQGLEVFYYSKKPSKYAREVANYENSVDEKFGIKEKYRNFIVNDLFYQMNQEKSIEFAQFLGRDISFITKEHNRGIYGANFQVLRNSKMPAVLLEVGFITNYYDAKKLITYEYQNKIAKGIVLAISQYFKHKEKTS